MIKYLNINYESRVCLSIFQLGVLHYEHSALGEWKDNENMCLIIGIRHFAWH